MNSLIKLKTLWQTTLTETEKEYWRNQLLAPLATAEDLRTLLREQLHIDLPHDWQLAEFRQWEFAQRAHAIHDEWLIQEARRLASERPDGTSTPAPDEILLKQICLQTAFANQDNLALRAVRSAVRCSTLDLHRERFKVSRQSKAFTGIELLHEESRHNPAIKAAIDNLREVLKASDPTWVD